MEEVTGDLLLDLCPSDFSNLLALTRNSEESSLPFVDCEGFRCRLSRFFFFFFLISQAEKIGLDYTDVEGMKKLNKNKKLIKKLAKKYHAFFGFGSGH